MLQRTHVTRAVADSCVLGDLGVSEQLSFLDTSTVWIWIGWTNSAVALVACALGIMTYHTSTCIMDECKKKSVPSIQKNIET